MKKYKLKIKVLNNNIIFFITLITSFIFGSIFAQKTFAVDITISTNTTWESGIYTYGNVSITNSAILTFNGTVALNAQNLTIDSGSSISADGKGYGSASGPGKGGDGFCSAGGGYGGTGGASRAGATGGSTYGSITEPLDLGSGGGKANNGPGGAGGGAIRLTVEGMLTVNGSLTANGAQPPGWGAWEPGGGSGGSIYLIVGTLSGNGVISANGGNCAGANWGGGGGGGRIAIYYQTNTFTGTVSACGGSGYKRGGAGTVLTKSSSQILANLSIDNCDQLGETTPLLDGTYTFESVEVSNDAKLELSEGDVLNTNQLIVDTGGQVIDGGDIETALVRLESGGTFLLNKSETIGNMHITSGGLLSQLAGQAGFNLTISNNLIIDSGSSISADGKGYGSASGPGKGGDGFCSAGGGYGGTGGASRAGATGGSTYGSITEPLDLGSGGGKANNGPGGAGGGAIRLMVEGTLTVNGSLTANGAQPPGWGAWEPGGGSGGSIYLIVGTLSGNGVISANGGNCAGANWGGGGGGGRIAIYYQASSFTGTTEAKGGRGFEAGEDGTIIFQPLSSDAPVALFNLLEKSSTSSTSSETISTQEITLNNVSVTGELSGSLDFTKFEIIKITSGSFADKGFSQGEFQAILEGVVYKGYWKGVSYFSPIEKKIYLKGEISGDLNGICEATIVESIPESNIYNKYQAVWRLNRIGRESTSVTLNLERILSCSPAYAFNSNIYLYQANLEGSCSGFYTGPLSAVVTHLRLIGENEYKGKGFSIISYNSAFGQGQGWAYNQESAVGRVDFKGLFKDPLLGKLSAFLDETKSPKVLSGILERLDFGALPAPDLKVKVIAPTRVSPGQNINYIIEYRNDGVRAATEAILYFYPDALVVYKSASQGAYYNNYAHRATWNLGALPAKSVGYVNIQVELPWGLPQGLSLENRAYVLDIVLHSTEENGVVNGICFDPIDTNGNKDFEQFVHDNDAKWHKLYANTNVITGFLEGWLATEDITTSRNGVGQTSEIVGYRPRWIGFSAGATTLINQANHGRISGEELYVVSPQIMPQEYIRATKSQFNKVIVYQGDDLMPNEGFTFKTNSFTITIPWSTLPNTLTRDKIIELFESSDNTINDLIEKFEEANGNRTLDYLEIFPKEEGNRIKITWEDSTSSNFLTTHTLQSEENIELRIIPGIKHQEWIPLFNKFEEKYHRWPTSEDLDKLKNILEKDIRKEGAGKSLQTITTAHDPNIKYGPQGNVLPGQRLTYKVEYENEGEGIAFGVYFTDTLDEVLDDSTLGIGPVIDIKTGVQIASPGTYNPATRTITWLVGEVGSKEGGYAEFSVNVKGNTPANAEIINFATVFFPSVPEVTRTNGIVNKVVTVIDNVPPATMASVLPIPNTAGWNKSEVTVTLTSTDNEGGSGVKEIYYKLSGAASDEKIVSGNTAQISIASEGITNLTYWAVDNAGNTEPQKSIAVKIDMTPPEVIINTPVEEAEYILNANILADWSATDSISGINQATATVPNGGAIDTATIGSKGFSVTASDNAGNNTHLSLTYNVRYSYVGLLPPINQDGSSIFKLGRTVPVKFQLKDALGNYISTAVARIYLAKISDDVIGDEIEAESTSEATTGNLFRYDSTDNQYIFNLGTKGLSVGSWKIRVALDDDTSRYTFISLK